MSYANGVVVLGEEVSSIIGANVRQWDNRQIYEPGEVVYYDLRFWKARYRVEPPWMPALMSGDVPGKSDCWYEITYQQAYNPVVGEDDSVIGEIDRLFEVLGAFDVQLKRREMVGLRVVTISIAQALLGGGQRAIDLARQLAQKYSFPTDNVKDIDKAHWKLKWHEAEIAKQAATPQALYSHANDLKEWVIQAFIEANAAEEGAWTHEGMTVAQMWTDMWYVVQKELAKLPEAIRRGVSAGVYAVTGVPMWAWIVGGTAFVGLLGFASYRLATGPLGKLAVRRLTR